MVSATHSSKIQAGYLLPLFAGFLIIIDTVWGAIAVLPLDWTRLNEAVLGVSFLIGLPAYVFDLRRDGRGLVFLPAVVVMRWLAESYAAFPAPLGRPWTGNLLIIAGSLLLQWSKLLSGKPGGRGH